MQRADEMPDMITIHSMRVEGGGRVREHRGSESEEGGWEWGRRMG